MIALVTYDITDPRRLNSARGFLKEFGLRTQKSVFECDVDDIALQRIRNWCRGHLDMEKDSVRIYRICMRCIGKVVLSGSGLKVTQLEYMIV